MMNHKNRKSWRTVIIMLLVLAVLPLNALALTEDTLEPAPETGEFEQEFFAGWYLPAAGKPARRNAVSADETNDKGFGINGFTRPWLTDLELARTRRLMEQVAAGEATYTGRSIVNAACNSNTGVGVYPLNPADYDGETYYVLLPKDMPLADNQILALIAAFEELGIPFDPDSLGGRNCHRDSTDGSRELTMEERQRLETIRMLVRRGTLKRENVPEGTADYGIPRPGAVSDDWFFLYPYRSMTDDELTLLALHTDSRWEDDPLELEQTARDTILSVYPEAGSLNNDDITVDSWGDVTDNGRYYILYRVNMSAGSWENGDSRYFAVEFVKEYGNKLEISSVDVDLSFNTFTNRGTGTREGWIAAAREWAESSLKVPDGKMPETWSLTSEPQTYHEPYYYVSPACVSGETPEWEVTVQVEPDTMKVRSGGITSKKWKHIYWGSKVPGEAGYMPSNARPANRDTVPADGKTDPQMVIRHENYHAEEDGFYLPWLTDLELARTRELMKQVDAGTITYTGPSAVNASGNMDGRVGVYPLNPADFDGEEFYVLLPQYDSLTDEQILSLIAAFEDFGLPFDPDSLCGRNCNRNMWFRQTRCLTDAEEERLEKARDLVRRGKVTAEDIPEGTPDGYMEYMEMEWYDEDACFHFYPYREMTDDEINRLALHYDEKWEADPEDVRQRMTEAIHSFLRNPPEMEMDSLDTGCNTEEESGTYSYTAVFYGYGTENSRITRIGMDLCQEAGHEPEIGFIQAWYNDNIYGEKTNARTEEEQIAAIQEWAAENVQLPDGQVPDTWTVEHSSAEFEGNVIRYTYLKYRTPEWRIEIEYSDQDPDTWFVNLNNNKWYPEK